MISSLFILIIFDRIHGMQSFPVIKYVSDPGGLIPYGKKCKNALQTASDCPRPFTVKPPIHISQESNKHVTSKKFWKTNITYNNVRYAFLLRGVREIYIILVFFSETLRAVEYCIIKYWTLLTSLMQEEFAEGIR